MRWWRGGAPSALVLGGLLLAACASPPQGDPRYRPAESLLEVVAVLRRHVPDDTYRFEPARDFTGRNVYRASLLRIENLESAYEEAYRSGYMAEAIHFAKARALERLRAYDLAAEHYLEAAGEGGELRGEALRSAALCGGLQEAVGLDPWAPTPLAELPTDLLELDGRQEPPTDPEPPAPDPEAGESPPREEVLSRFERRAALLEAILVEARGTHHEAIVMEEIELGDVHRARYLTGLRTTYDDGDVQAVAAWQRVVLDHRDSKNKNRHLLELADLYAELASGYVARNPPESLRFDPPTFEELATSATRLYETVANQDGATERIEAARRLEAFLAFTLRIDRDRFSR